MAEEASQGEGNGIHSAIISDRSVRLAEVNSLSRSPTRFKILDLICDSPHSQADLRRELDIHRTTLRKNLVELAAKNWIEDVPTENVYRALPAGRIVAESIHETIADFRIADHFGDCLTRLPEAPSISARALRDCEITSCASSGPYAPMMKVIKLVRKTDTFRGLTPVFDPMYVEPFGAQIAGNFEVLGPSEFFDAFRSDYPQAFEMAMCEESVRLFVSADPPQFGVSFLDDTVVIGTYDRNMRLHSILEARDDQPELVEWAEQQYDEQRKAASEYKPTDG